MRVAGIFKVQNFKPAELKAVPEVTTALPLGVTTFDKTYEGDVSGRSSAIFVSAFDPSKGGTYVCMEGFDGSLGGKSGTFNFWHAASTTGKDRTNEVFFIVAGSGTRELAGIHGSGGIVIEPDGTHRVFFDADGI
jgi:hypothetical protein